MTPYNIKIFFLICILTFLSSCNSFNYVEETEKICQPYLIEQNIEKSCQQIKKTPDTNELDLRKLCKSCRALARAKVRLKKIEKWVAIDDLKKICEVSKKIDTKITFRKSGKYTIEKLSLGYPTKGHDILDKTIKPKSLEHLKKIKAIDHKIAQNFLPTNWQNNRKLKGKELIKKLDNLGYFGFVGWWEKDSQQRKIPVGIYTVYSGCEKLKKPNETTKIIPAGGCRLSFKEIGEKPPKDTFTGDYDMHDVIKSKSNLTTENEKISPRTIKVTQDTSHDYGRLESECDSLPIESKVACLINKTVDRKCNVTEISKRHCNLIRHGAQANYLNFTRLNGELIRPYLVSISEKILVIDPRKKAKGCNFYLLGKQKHLGIINEYLNLYKLSNLNRSSINKHKMPYLAIRNSFNRNTTDKELVALELKSLEKTTQILAMEIQKSFGKINKDIKKDCIELLYRAELLQEIIQDKPSFKTTDIKNALQASYNNFCSQNYSNNCVNTIIKFSGSTGRATWSQMSFGFCTK